VAGFKHGTEVRYRRPVGPAEDTVSSTLACFNTELAARAQDAQWGGLADGCIDGNLSLYDAANVDLGTVIGAASKGRYCSATDGTGLVQLSLSVYVQSGTVVFSVRYTTGNVDFEPNTEVTSLLVRAAQALESRL
jgi:hypothetical protein